MLGAGLYAGVHRMAAVAGNASFLGWIIVALLNLPIAYAISRIASLIPEAGGFYRYTERVFGHRIGFFNGWLYFLSYIYGLTAILGFFREDLLSKLSGVPLVQNGIMFSVIVMATIGMLNLLHISMIGSIQKYLTAIKLTPVIILFIILPFFFHNGLPISSQDLINITTPKAWTMALLGFLGFEFACQLSQQIENGAKNTARVVMSAFGIATAIYTFFTLGLLIIMGHDNLAQFHASGYPLFIGSIFPTLVSPLTLIVAVAVFICFINSLNGILTVTTAQISAMVDAKILRGADLLGRSNKAGRPWILIFFITACVVLIGAVTPSLEQITNAFIIGLTGTYAITCSALVSLQWQQRRLSGLLAALAGLLIAVSFIYIEFMQLGSSFSSRLLALSPLLIGLLVGLIIARPIKNLSAGFMYELE